MTAVELQCIVEMREFFSIHLKCCYTERKKILICNFIGKLLLHFLTNCHINYKTLETIQRKVATCMMYFILRWILKCCFVVEIRPWRAV